MEYLIKIIIGILAVVGLIYILAKPAEYVSPKEKQDCLKETGNIYCNGPMGD